MSGPRILVVDDEPDILLSLRILFEGELGGQVIVSTMPRVALLALRAKPGFDLVIADYRMPGMDGLEFLQQAKEIQPKTPRILMTAFLTGSLEKDAVAKAGVALCLAKPLDPVKLLQAVAGLLPPRPAPHAEPKKRAAPKPGRIPLYDPPRRGKEADEPDLVMAACSVCRGQMVVDPGDWGHARGGWVARPCFITPGCRGTIQP